MTEYSQLAKLKNQFESDDWDYHLHLMMWEICCERNWRISFRHTNYEDRITKTGIK